MIVAEFAVMAVAVTALMTGAAGGLVGKVKLPELVGVPEPFAEAT